MLLLADVDEYSFTIAEDVTPVHQQWNYVFLPLTHQYNFTMTIVGYWQIYQRIKNNPYLACRVQLILYTPIACLGVSYSVFVQGVLDKKDHVVSKWIVKSDQMHGDTSSQLYTPGITQFIQHIFIHTHKHI